VNNSFFFFRHSSAVQVERSKSLTICSRSLRIGKDPNKYPPFPEKSIYRLSMNLYPAARSSDPHRGRMHTGDERWILQWKWRGSILAHPPTVRGRKADGFPVEIKGSLYFHPARTWLNRDVYPHPTNYREPLSNQGRIFRNGPQGAEWRRYASSSAAMQFPPL
jgi:hypothetical protein